MSPLKTLTTIALLIGACAALPATAAADPLTVRIGFAAPLTGDNAGYGRDLQNGVQLALDDANAQNIHVGDQLAHFTLVAVDDQSDPRQGMLAARHLVDANVSVVVGHFNSGTTLPASRIYESAGIPMISPAATNAAITSQGFANTFMVIPTDAQNAGNAASYALDVSRARRIAIIDDRSAFGQGEADEFERAVKAQGGNIVARDYTNSQATDLRPVLAKIQPATPDLVYFGGLDAQAATLARQMKQLGVTAQLVTGGGVRNSQFIRLAGPAAEGVMAWEYGRPLADMPLGKRFAHRFHDRYGVDVLSYAPFGYDAAWAAIKAMENAKSASPDAYRASLKTVSFDGVTGHIAFDGNGTLKNGASTLYQVKNGDWVPLVTRGGN